MNKNYYLSRIKLFDLSGNFNPNFKLLYSNYDENTISSRNEIYQNDLYLYDVNVSYKFENHKLGSKSIDKIIYLYDHSIKNKYFSTIFYTREEELHAIKFLNKYKQILRNNKINNILLNPTNL